MPLPNSLRLEKAVYKVCKTGLPFYDAARLIGVAHLFFGTASAEVVDKGSYWIVSGVSVARDEQQIKWVLSELNPTKREASLFEKDRGFQWNELQEYFLHKYRKTLRREELKVEYDAALQTGTRGFDPLSKYEILAPRSTGETLKKFKVPFPELAAATLGRAFAARVVSRTNRQKEEIYILPVFREKFVLSGFLEYNRKFQHAAGGWVAVIWASLAILLDLTAKRLPVVDFVYTEEVKGPTQQPIFSRSGYLGLERLCQYWWQAVREEKRDSIRLLRNFRQFLQYTTRGDIDQQVQNLARWVADFLANPNADALVKIEQLKARINAASQNQRIQGADAVKVLLNDSILIREVKGMMGQDLPEVPWQISEALAHALGFDERGWMNQFTRLENASEFSQFIQQVEHILSRGFYREEQKEGKQPDIRRALSRAKDLANILRGIASALGDAKTFRAWRAIFLLDVLSRIKIGTTSSTEERVQNVTE